MADSRIAVITGGSRGIGAATATLLAGCGYDVCIIYRTDDAAACEVVDEIERLGKRALCIKADVAIEKDVRRAFEACDQALGSVTALVNNAGIVAAKARIDEIDLERFRQIFDVNVTGTFLCCREAIKRMSPRHGGKGGCIVNVSSVASRIGSPGEYVDYAASKGAIDTFTLGLARELADERIRVNAVRPGIIDTEIHASGGQPDRLDRLKKNIPMQRGGTAIEVAQAIGWLLSDEASYSTGAMLDVSGGR